MIRLIVDPALRAKLRHLTDQLELCDENGRVLGVFVPSQHDSLYNAVDSPASQNALDRAEQEPVRSLVDVLRDLRKQ